MWLKKYKFSHLERIAFTLLNWAVCHFLIFTFNMIKMYYSSSSKGYAEWNALAFCMKYQMYSNEFIYVQLHVLIWSKGWNGPQGLEFVCLAPQWWPPDLRIWFQLLSPAPRSVAIYNGGPRFLGFYGEVTTDTMSFSTIKYSTFIKSSIIFLWYSWQTANMCLGCMRLTKFFPFISTCLRYADLSLEIFEMRVFQTAMSSICCICIKYVRKEFNTFESSS